MKIEFYKDVKKNKKIKKEYIGKINEILNSGKYTNAKNVELFEFNFKKYNKSKYCVAVNSGTSALHLSLLSLGIGKGDEVLVPSISFVASAASVNYTGAKPVFVDINSDDWLINHNKIEEKITKRTRAILVVHLHGLMCEMKKIKKIAKKNKLFLIEDASQAHGSLYFGKSAGYYSDISTFSFYPTKNLGAIGEGGAIITNSKFISNKCMKLRDWAKSKKDFFDIGYNYRMLETVACSLNIKLKYLDEDITKRIKIANFYKKNLLIKSYSEFDQKVKRHSYHIFAILLKNRKKIINYLNQKKIYTNSHYSYCLPYLNFYNKKYQDKDFKVGLQFSRQTLSLPIYPDLSLKELNYIVNTLNFSLA